MSLTSRQKIQIKKEIKKHFQLGTKIQLYPGRKEMQRSVVFINGIIEIFDKFIEQRDTEYYPIGYRDIVKKTKALPGGVIKKRNMKKYVRYNTLEEPDLVMLIKAKMKEGMPPITAVKRTFPQMSEKDIRMYIAKVCGIIK